MGDGAHRHPALITRVQSTFGVEHPIVQTGMGWVSGVSLTAATAAAGGLGFLAATTMSPERMVADVASVRGRTDRPFGVNLRGDQHDLTDRLDALLAAGVTIVSFAGPPSAEAVARCHDRGALVIVTVGARRHAEKMLERGVDAIIAQGHEGGGHTGPVPTSLLVPEVVEAVGADIPVLGAGGFHDGRGLAAALAWGADGVAMGTRFLLTRESRVPDHIKRHYLAAGLGDTVVTAALDGAPQRVIRTEVIDRLESRSSLRRLPSAVRTAFEFRKATDESLVGMAREALAMRRHQDMGWAQVVTAANAPMLTKASMVDGDEASGILPAGQNVGVIDDLPTVAELIERILADADAALRQMTDPNAGGGNLPGGDSGGDSGGDTGGEDRED